VQIAPLVFTKLFFPSSDPLVGVLQAFGIMPSALFRVRSAPRSGHFGDRFGRKVTLINTLLLPAYRDVLVVTFRRE
jgi:hypothetical protein